MKNAVLVAILTSAILIVAVYSVYAQSYPVTYEVENESELLSVMAIFGADTDPNKNYLILFTDNIVLWDPNTIDLVTGGTVTLDLQWYNFQGDGSLTIEGTGGNHGTVNIIGSTTVFNGGLKVKDNITLNYSGIYTAEHVDVLGESIGDDVTINFTEPFSGWNARAAKTEYIDDLPVLMTDFPEGTIIVGYNGTAEVNIGAGNWVENTETIIGATSYPGIGTVNITGNGTNWKGLGSFYVGYYGQGELNVTDGALLQVGAIEIGRMIGSTGELNVSGKGTQVILFGRDDHTRGTLSGIADWSEGEGTMTIQEGALVLFDHTKTLNKTPSAFVPKITLGEGESVVDNSWIIGKLSESYLKEATETEPAVTFESFFNADPLEFETFFDKVGGAIIGSPTTTSLTFKNNARLLGSLKITAGTTTFTDGAVLSPGFGKYDDHVSFGRVDFTGDFVHKEDAKTYIDFNVHGDTNFESSKAYANDVYDGKGYLQNLGRDTIKVAGDIALDGNIYFRPQSGYYSDDIDIHFMQQTGGSITGQYELNLFPTRWFENERLDKSTGDGNHLCMDRNTTPFTDAANSINTQAVGGALDRIYNAQRDKDWLVVLNWVWLMNDQQLLEAMRQLSGETRAASFHMPIKSPWKFAFDRINWTRGGNLSIYFGQQNTSSVKTSKNDIWANVFYDGIHMYGENNATSASTSRVSFMAGYDRALTYKSSVGFLFSHSQPRLTQGWSRVSADDYLFGFHYANRIYDYYELKLWAGYGTQQYRLQRSVPIPDIDGRLSANYTGNTATASAMLARPYNWRNGVFRPFAAFDLSYVQQNGATEQGFKPIVLQYADDDWTQFFGRVGVRADFGWQTLNITTSLAYSRLLFGHEDPRSQNRFIHVKENAPFEVRGNNLGSDFLDFGLGTQIYLCREGKGNPSSTSERIKRDSMAFLQYNGSYGTRSNIQTASIGYQYNF